jgi:DNA-binding CsgD family transcriptional regulator
MPLQKYKLFNEFSIEGREFTKIWLSADRDGIQNILAKRFNISISTVYKIRKYLNLPDLHSGEHPGRRKFEKRIKRLYLWGLQRKRINGISTIRIAKLVKMSSQNVTMILRKHGVALRPQHCVDPLYFKTKSRMTPSQLIIAIRRMYLDEKKSARRIAHELGLDQATVSTKLKAMEIRLRYLRHNKPLKKGYSCQWCAKIMDAVYLDKGIRRQKFCSHSCSDRAKDYRRMLKSKFPPSKRLSLFNKFLHDVWKEDYDNAVKRLINVKPINEVTNEKRKSP